MSPSGDLETQEIVFFAAAKGQHRNLGFVVVTILRGGDEDIASVHAKVKTLADSIGPQMRPSSGRYLASFDSLVEADRQVAAREKICKAASDRLAEAARTESDRWMSTCAAPVPRR